MVSGKDVYSCTCNSAKWVEYPIQTNYYCDILSSD